MSSEENKRTVGRPKYEPKQEERDQVRTWSAAGVPQKQICQALDISLQTLNKYYRTELDEEKIKRNLQVGNTLYSKAIEGDNACLIWWSKTQMGWKDTSNVELTGADGGPVCLAAVDAPRRESREEWLNRENLKIEESDES